MSVRIMAAVFEIEGLTPVEKLVALALADHAHDDGTEARPGVNGLSRKCGVTERTAQRALRSLQDKRIIFVQRESTQHMPRWYQFNLNFRGNISGVTNETSGATNETPGVTSTTSRGGMGVTLTIIEPSIEPSIESSPSFQDVDVAPRDFIPETIVYELCHELNTRIVDNNNKPFLLNKSNLMAMESLTRLDGYTFQEILDVIDWCQRDQFWFANIRSPKKLRDKFETLIAQMKRSPSQKIKQYLEGDDGGYEW